MTNQAKGDSVSYMHIINRPCGHSMGLDCGCSRGSHTFAATTGAVDARAFNGLCECRGPLNRHPFHSAPLPPEYVGRHRAE